jgi:hypothetical protein
VPGAGGRALSFALLVCPGVLEGGQFVLATGAGGRTSRVKDGGFGLCTLFAALTTSRRLLLYESSFSPDPKLIPHRVVQNLHTVLLCAREHFLWIRCYLCVWRLHVRE